MNELRAKKINFTPITVQNTSEVFKQEKIASNKIASVNWKTEYPYQPLVEFAIAHNGDNIFLHFQIEEEGIKALRSSDNADVWNDSCVEFFISFEGESFYYNIEVNCIGAVLVSVGSNKNDRKLLSTDEVGKVERYSSLGTSIISGDNKLQKWELSLAIPKEVFILSNIKSFSGVKTLANFYKCGDELKTPHFLSWNPIETDSPNFHVPAFFGKLEFE